MSHKIFTPEAQNPRAFPASSGQEYGMTLRDYFAAKALESAFSHWPSETFGQLAKFCYQVADEMLKERCR